MNPRHQLRRGLLLAPQNRNLVIVAGGSRRQVAEPTIGVDGASRLNGFPQKRQQTFRRCVLDTPHPDSPDPWPILLRGDYNQRLASCVPSARALVDCADIGLVYLDPPGQSVPPRSNHRATQFVQPSPSRLIALQFEHSLKAQCAGSVLLGRYPVHRAKPIDQRLARVLEDRPRCHRGLVAAFSAFHQHRSHRPILTARTSRASKPLRPAKPKQVLAAGLLGWELLVKLAQVARELLHSLPYYRLGLPESSEYPPSHFRIRF